MIDPKEVNIPVKWDDLVEYLIHNERAFVYLKTGDKFETIVLRASEYFSKERTMKYIEEGRLFRRRNKPFQNCQV